MNGRSCQNLVHEEIESVENELRTELKGLREDIRRGHLMTQTKFVFHYPVYQGIR